MASEALYAEAKDWALWADAQNETLWADAKFWAIKEEPSRPMWHCFVMQLEGVVGDSMAADSMKVIYQRDATAYQETCAAGGLCAACHYCVSVARCVAHMPWQPRRTGRSTRPP